MNAEKLIQALKQKLGVKTDSALAKALGITGPALIQWRNQKNDVSALQLANTVAKVRDAAKKDAHRAAIKPLVEFFPIYAVQAGKKQEVFETGKNAGKQSNGLRTILEASQGLYVFYDTRGRALYAGQTKKQNLWKELNSAFNRDRSAQVMTLVRHPTNDVDFRPAYEKVRQPTDINLKLHDLAAYFSAYAVADGMIDDLEALLVRVFPNDLLNFKMEKFGKTAKKKPTPAKTALKSKTAKKKAINK
ncbi:MAG TPA: hypothetical protein VMV91_07190 [Rhodocyclaceae bacterium]|nr:hypothetical protein [Rhodocyclaceae bacterium]